MNLLSICLSMALSIHIFFDGFLHQLGKGNTGKGSACSFYPSSFWVDPHATQLLIYRGPTKDRRFPGFQLINFWITIPKSTPQQNKYGDPTKLVAILTCSFLEQGTFLECVFDSVFTFLSDYDYQLYPKINTMITYDYLWSFVTMITYDLP